MFLLDVTLSFDRSIRQLIEKHCKDKGDWKQIHAFIKNHERKPVVLRNLCDQIFMQEKKVGVRLDKSRRDKLIEATAMMFIDQAIKKRNQDLKSNAEKQRIKDESVSPEDRARDKLGDMVQEIDRTVELN